MVLLVAAADAPATYHYHLDEAQSRVSARVAFFGLASKTASFPRMIGSITLQPQKLDAIDLKVVLDARALTAGDSVTLARLKGKNFFDVEHYPTVSFTGQRMTMTGPVTARVEGELTARGVTRPVVIQVVFAQPPARAKGREPVALTARTVINRRDFGMTAYSLVVGKKVTITVDARLTPG
jgi:polyisoprenoid-binding protein YceI